MYVEMDGSWNETLEINANKPFILAISVKDNWEVESVTITSGAAGVNSQVMDKLGDNNNYNITTGSSFYYHYFEGLKSDSYSFSFYAVDPEGNSNTKKISLTIG